MTERIMGPGRLEAFSDGVIAILITIMVLELRVPASHEPAALSACGRSSQLPAELPGDRDLLGQSPRAVSPLPGGERRGAVDQHRVPVLHLAHSVRHRLHGREPLHAVRDRALRRHPAAGGVSFVPMRRAVNVSSRTIRTTAASAGAPRSRTGCRSRSMRRACRWPSCIRRSRWRSVTRWRRSTSCPTPGSASPRRERGAALRG